MWRNSICYAKHLELYLEHEKPLLNLSVLLVVSLPVRIANLLRRRRIEVFFHFGSMCAKTPSSVASHLQNTHSLM